MTACPAHDRSAQRLWWWWLIAFFLVLTLLLIGGTTGRTRTLWWNTGALAAGAIAISLPVGTLLAWLVVRTDVRGRGPALWALAVLLLVPLYLQTAAWDAGFGQQGWFQAARVPLQSTPLLSGLRGAIWVHAMGAIPWVALLATVGLTTMVREWEDLALLDASGGRVFWKVTLRHSCSALFVAALWVLIQTAGEISVTDVFQVRTYAEELYVGYVQDVPGGEDALLGLPAGAWSGTLIVAWLVLAGTIVCAWLGPRDRPASVELPRVFRLRAWRWPATGLLALLLLGLVGIPLGNLGCKLGLVVRQVGDERIRSWSLVKAVSVLADAPCSFREELGWSLALAQLAATTAIGLAVPMAWWATRNRRAAAAAACLVALGLAVPGPTLGLGLIRVFSPPDSDWLAYFYNQTIAAPWIALTIRCLPLVTLILWLAFRSVPAAIVDSARLDGAGTLRLLWAVVLPERIPALACAWLVAVAVAAGDLTASILVVPPGVTTVSIRIFGLVHYGVEDRLAALCLWSLILFTGFALAVLWMARQWWADVLAPQVGPVRRPGPGS